MKSEDKAGFTKLLAGVMAGYGKALPDRSMVGVWFDLLTPFAPQAIAAAFSAYTNEQPDFVPTPNGIAVRARLMDGRPGSEEAWALSLTSMDEQNTVVWTQECAQAFAAAKPVLDASGSISARKTFIEVYERLVGEARQNRAAPHWFASPGLDAIGRAAAIKRAVASGLMLPAPAAPLQLEGMAKAETFSLSPRQQLDHIRKMVLDGIAEKQRRADAEIDARIEAEDEIGADIQRKVDQHIGGAA